MGKISVVAAIAAVFAVCASAPQAAPPVAVMIPVQGAPDIDIVLFEEIFGPISSFVEKDVTAVCPLCGHKFRTTMVLPPAAEEVNVYCSAKQCQWTRKLEDDHPDWSRDTCLVIAKHRVTMGMTPEQVRESWGLPKDINRTVGSWGVHEQWVYGVGRYLYFRNRKLTSWQN